MSHVCSSCPFDFQCNDQIPWLLWEKRNEVTSLPDVNKTDGRFDIVAAVEDTETPAVPAIQRMQYNSVLSRMNQAIGRTGSYSAWQA